MKCGRIQSRATLSLLLAASAFSCATLAAAESTLTESLRWAELARDLVATDAAGRLARLERIDAAPPCAARDAERILAVELLACADPARARAYVERRNDAPPQTAVLWQALVRGWVRLAPDDAWAWSRERPASPDLDLAATALETVAQAAPERGLKWLLEAPGPASDEQAAAQKERAFAFFRSLAGGGDFAAGVRLIEAYPAGPARNELLFYFADQWAAYDEAGAAEWAGKRAQAADAFFPLVAVAGRKARADWEGALAWVLSLEEPALRMRLARTVAGEAVAREPTLPLMERLLERLEGRPERQAAYAALAASGRLMRLAPARIADLAWTIEARDERRAALARGYGNWRGFDAAAARQHLEKAGADRPEERTAIQRFLQREDRE